MTYKKTLKIFSMSDFNGLFGGGLQSGKWRLA